MHPRQASYRFCHLVGVVEFDRGYVFGRCKHDTHAFAARGRGQPDLLPLLLGPVEGREVVQDREWRLHTQQVLLGNGRGEPVDEHFAVGKLLRHPQRVLQSQYFLRRAVPLEADGKRREGRERCSGRASGLDHPVESACLGLAEQVVRSVEAVLTHTLLVAHPSFETRRVRHREA
eukprot:scaffold21436_cov28-Tisochrysis_lutea.AAC.1